MVGRVSRSLEIRSLCTRLVDSRSIVRPRSSRHLRHRSRATEIRSGRLGLQNPTPSSKAWRTRSIFAIQVEDSRILTCFGVVVCPREIRATFEGHFPDGRRELAVSPEAAGWRAAAVRLGSQERRTRGAEPGASPGAGSRRDMDAMANAPRRASVLLWVAIWIVLPVAAIFGGAALVENADREWEYVRAVTRADDGVYRFVGHVQVYFGDELDEVDRDAVTGIIGTLNALTRDGGVSWDGPFTQLQGDQGGDWLTVRLAAGDALANAGGAVHDALGYTDRRWLEGNRIRGAMVVLRQGRPDYERYATLLHEVGHALGLGHVPDHLSFSSVMGPEAKRYGEHREYTPLDRKVIRFTYRYLKPGDRLPEVRLAYRQYWSTIPDD